MYLVGNTRPDCASATHQCARLSHAPKVPHEIALKRIGRYLQGPREGGILLKSSTTVKVDCCVNADFAGIWGHEEQDEQSSVKSRTGYYILLGNVPVLWHRNSKLKLPYQQWKCSTLPWALQCEPSFPSNMSWVNSLKLSSSLPIDQRSTISRIFEDNQPALTPAVQDPPRLTPRSKHIAVKYPCFAHKWEKQSNWRIFKVMNNLQISCPNHYPGSNLDAPASRLWDGY